MSYARARWYDARNASFLSEDPLGDIDSPNLYQYARNSPFNFSDPLGLCSVGDWNWQCTWWVASGTVKNVFTSRDTYSTGVGFVPVAGDVKDWQEAVTGKDLITGEKIGWGGRAITAAAGIVPVLPGKSLRALVGLGSDLRKSDEIADAVPTPAPSGGVSRAAETGPAPEPITDPNRLLPSGPRPTPREAELHVEELYGFDAQRSFREGERIRYGAEGSVRPDLSHPDLSINLHLDVKNYDLSAPGNRANLYNTIAEQARNRRLNLPAGSHQGILIDIRGQIIPSDVLERIPLNIETATGGLIPSSNVVFIWE